MSEEQPQPGPVDTSLSVMHPTETLSAMISLEERLAISFFEVSSMHMISYAGNGNVCDKYWQPL
jgi:hypothetical protein